MKHPALMKTVFHLRCDDFTLQIRNIYFFMSLLPEIHVRPAELELSLHFLVSYML